MSFFSNLSSLFNSQTKPAAKKAEDQAKNKKIQPKSAVPPVIPIATAPAPIPAAVIDQQDIVREAKSKAREIIVEAKSEALVLRSQAEKEQRELLKQIEQKEYSLDQKIDRIDQKLSQLDSREAELEKQHHQAQQTRKDLQEAKDSIIKKLEQISGFTQEEGKQELFSQLEKKLSKEMATLVRQKQQEAEAEAGEKARELTIDAMKYGATDYVPEYTMSVVQLPSEDSKGKIIGRFGKNIYTLEKVTGADFDLDASPTEVRISCFDPVRREIARVSLERLIKDGRIQPTRIEETVAKVKSEIDKIIFEAGKQLCNDVGAYNLPPDLMKLLGKFKYRTSYGQNLIAHTMEETRIGIKLASELKLDVNTVRLGCLLHDIGKVSEEAEGSHVELGVKIAQKYGMPQAVVDCIAQHHEDEPFSGPEQVVVYVADAISGARPGARYENIEEYVKRLKQLEEIATTHKEVKEAYAIQAGREVRVILIPDQSKDDDVTRLSLEIRDTIKNTMTYPGTVTVTVIRETRSQNVAK